MPSDPASPVTGICQHTHYTQGRLETPSLEIKQQNTKHIEGRTRDMDHQGSAPPREMLKALPCITKGEGYTYHTLNKTLPASSEQQIGTNTENTTFPLNIL